MLDHIQHENQVKVALFLQKIAEPKLKFPLGSAFSKFKNLWRNVISQEDAIVIQSLLKLLQDFSSAASHVADCFRGDPILATPWRDGVGSAIAAIPFR